MPDLLARLKSALADRYAVESEIGRGGMATVFLAEDLKHHRKVAIKVLHPELGAAVGSERFLNEIETVASLHHPHVLMLIDSGEADGLLYYVMPHVAGESLRHRLDREKYLAVDEALRIAAEVADGLDYAHRHGVVHRDIKPGNILLSDGHAMIADFGIARAIEAVREERITSTGLGVGTPLYASPEQATGEETLDGRTDIYSLACVLYEMLAGEPPLTGATPKMIQARRMSETPTALHALRDTVPPALDEVIAQALARIPADRYATASQFGNALQAVQMGRTPGTGGDLAATPPVEVTDAGVAGPARQRSSVPRWFVAAVGLAVIVSIAAVVWTQTVGRSVTGYTDPIPAGATDLGSFSVAVLPLANDTGEDSLDWLVPGLANMLTADLDQFEALRVVGSQRPLDLMRQAALEEAARLPREQALNIGAGSGARTLVQGSFSRAANGLQLDVELIDLSDSTVVGTERARGVDLLALVDSVTAALAVRVLGDTIAPTDLTPLSRIATGSLEAYREYQEGLLAERRILNPFDLTAKEHFRRAVELDSTFAIAWLELGGPVYQWRNVVIESSALERAQELSTDVSERDRLSIQAYLAWASRRLDESASRLEELVAKYPDEKEGRFFLGWLYRDQDRPADSRRVLEEVLWLDPYNARAIDELSYQAARAGDDAWADSLWNRYVELESDQAIPYATRGEILRILGKEEEARVMAREAIRLDPDLLDGYSLLSLSYIAEGDPGAGRAALQPFKGTDSPTAAVLIWAYEADTYVAEGRYLDALASMYGALEKASESSSEYLPLLTGETGILANAAGLYEEAEELFQEALRLDPWSLYALFGILNLYGTQRRFDEMGRVRDATAVRIGSASDVMRGEAEGRLHFADALIAWYGRGDADETVRLFGDGRSASGRSMTEFDPGMGVQGEEVLALIEVGRASDALAIIDSIEARAKRGFYRLLQHAAWYLRGRAYEALGEPEQALQNYGELLEEVAPFRDTRERMVRLSAGLGAEP